MTEFLNLLGIWSFAAYGAYKARGSRFDIFGIFTIAFLCGLGGGVIRDALLHETPIFLSSPSYVIAVFLGSVAGLVPQNIFQSFNRSMLAVDALGLGAFAYTGAERADHAGLGFIGIVFFATITAVGGSILRDVCMQKIPEIFYQDFYATPAIILGTLYFLLRPWISFWPIPFSLVFFAFVVRMLAIHYKIQLWKPRDI